MRIAPDLPPVRLLDSNLRQILYNLILNALQLRDFAIPNPSSMD